MTDQTPEYQRWTAKRKAAVVLDVLKGQTTSVDACRKYGIKQSELEEWTERFLERPQRAEYRSSYRYLLCASLRRGIQLRRIDHPKGDRCSVSRKRSLLPPQHDVLGWSTDFQCDE